MCEPNSISSNSGRVNVNLDGHTFVDRKARTANLSYPSSAAAVVFGVHLSAQSRVLGIDPDTSGQSAPALAPIY
jgi:hypothetical protein